MGTSASAEKVAKARSRTGEASIPEKFEAKAKAWARRPEILQSRHRYFLGDARQMNELDEEIHLVVTSPPYWDLKEYPGADGQLGHIHDRQEFLDAVGQAWQRCYDLLVPGGRLCVVVGDVCRSRRKHGRHLVDPLHAYLQVQCQEMGFDPLAPILWYKIANAVTEVAGNGTTFLGKPYEPNAIIKNDVEYILLFRKPGGYRKPTQEQRDLSMIDKDDHRRWFQQVWADVPGELQRGHPAPFPPEIARRLIGMFSFVGDTVLDPFMGMGNTMIAASRMHRSSVGFEIEQEFFEKAKAKLSRLPFEDAEVEFID